MARAPFISPINAPLRHVMSALARVVARMQAAHGHITPMWGPTIARPKSAEMDTCERIMEPSGRK